MGLHEFQASQDGIVKLYLGAGGVSVSRTGSVLTELEACEPHRQKGLDSGDSSRLQTTGKCRPVGGSWISYGGEQGDLGARREGGWWWIWTTILRTQEDCHPHFVTSCLWCPFGDAASLSHDLKSLMISPVPELGGRVHPY